MFFPQGNNTPFRIDPNSTPEQLLARRQMLKDMMPRYGSARYVGEGLGQLAMGLAERSQNRQLDALENKQRESITDKFRRLLGGGTATDGAPILGPTPYAPPVDPNSPQAVASDTMKALGKGPTDRELLAKTLMAEAGGEGPIGMLAAGSVINNRVKSGNYGDGISGVIMKPGQFSAWNGVTGYAGGEGGLDMESIRPSEQAYRIADLLMSGQYSDPTGGATHYYNPNVANPEWGRGGDWQRIGNHVFGKADAGRVASNTGQIDVAALAEIVASPYAGAGQRAVAQALLEQQMKAWDPAYQADLEYTRLQNDALRNPTPKDVRTDDMREYDAARAQGFQGTLQDWILSQKKAGASTTNIDLGNGVPANDAALRKKLGEKEGEVWSSYLEAGTVSAGTVQDMQLLNEILPMAPQGPIQGRLAGAFPGVSSAADAFNSIVKRVAPTLRAPGSGSTSDIEYDGMLKSLPQLSAKPEANRAIAAMMQAKAEINVKRAEIVRQAQNDEISVKDARRMMSELDQQSIMTPELKAILGQLSPSQTPENSTSGGVSWKVVE